MAKKTGLPQLSHLQFAALCSVGIEGKSGISGKNLRARLGQLGIKTSGPAFYQMMTRLRDMGFTQDRYSQQIVGSQIIRETHYRLTAKGGAALREVSEFYGQVLSLLSSTLRGLIR